MNEFMTAETLIHRRLGGSCGINSTIHKINRKETVWDASVLYAFIVALVLTFYFRCRHRCAGHSVNDTYAMLVCMVSMGGYEILADLMRKNKIIQDIIGTFGSLFFWGRVCGNVMVFFYVCSFRIKLSRITHGT